MERYTQFRDAGTGIAPFLPLSSASRPTLLLPIELCCCILRLSLLAVVGLIHFLIVEPLCDYGLRSVSGALVAWIRYCSLRTILFSLGVVHIEEVIDSNQQRM